MNFKLSLPFRPLPARYCAWCALSVWLATGCAGTAFSLSFPDNQRSAIEKLMGALGPRPRRPQGGQPMAYIVTRRPTKIVAYDLAARRTRWSTPARLSSRIFVGGERLFHADGKTLVARSAASGRQLWQSPIDSGRILGVAADNQGVYVVTEATSRASGDGAAAHLTAYSAESGQRRWQQPSSGRLGAPAVRGGLVFVPLRFQSIALIDGKSGKEQARVRSKDEALLWVRSTPAGVLFGGKSGVYRLDPAATAGTRKGSTFFAAKLPASVRPAYWWDGYNAALAGYTAYDRNRLLWRPRGRGQGFAGNAIFVHNYRFFFAFSGSGKGGRSKLVWAYGFPRHDVVASTFTGRALLLVSARGDVVVLDAERGLPTSRRALRLAVRGVTFDAAGFTPSGTPKGRVDLERTLTKMIWDPDRRFGEVKLFCVEQLAKLSGARIAEALVEIVTRPGIDPKVYKRAGDMIVARHDSKAIPLYLKVLKHRYSFVEGTRSMAVDVMARALGDLKAPEAVRPLLRHLADHETPLAAVTEIARALKAIGNRSVVRPLRDFLLTYRCEPEFRKAPAALNTVADALLEMGGEEERQLLQFVGNDSHTLQSLRVYVAAALRQAKKPSKKKQPQKKPIGKKPGARASSRTK